MSRAAVFALCALSLVACKYFDPTSAPSDFDIDAGVPDLTLPEGAYFGPGGTIESGKRVGEACTGDSACRPGLSCEADACAPSGDAAEDDGCVLSAECGAGLSCGFPADCWENATTNPLTECGFSACLPNAGRAENEVCALPGDCGDGLRCNLVGFTGICEPSGSGDVGQACEQHADCADPLLCAPPSDLTGTDGFSCQIPAAVAGELFMPSPTCEDRDEDAPFAVHFEVPGDEPAAEFYRLPFPNDIRLRNGRVDMSGHHNPGLAYIGGEIVDLYLEAAEQLDGFSTNPAVFFRFTQNPNFGSFRGGSDAPTVRFVNIDPDSPGYGNDQGMEWAVTTGGGKFICPRYMAIRPPWTNPLEHGTTYAVLLTDGIRSADGEAPEVQADFAAMMADSSPGSGRMGDAWAAYQPLRDFVADQGLDGGSIVAAAVFTTMDPDADMAAIRAATRAEAAPELANVTRCGANVTGPCGDGERGACVNASGDFIEIHATYTAPVLQRGARPYLLSDDGGDIEISGGSAQVAGDETMCVSLSIPTGEMPENGWPVAMFGHGTGGSFTSHISGGTAGRLANIDLGDDTVRIASVGIDGPQHGPRRGDSDLSPEPLFYNFANPLSAVGNVQQGAADFFFLTYLLENLDLDIDGVGEVRFDVQNMLYFGHSQGATVGGLFAGYEESLKAAVFSGAGGSLVLSLLNKTSPQDIAGGVEFVLTDGGRSGSAVSDKDPLLAILQWVIDPVDPLNYGRLYSRQPVSDEAAGVHVFQSYGYGDTYSPEPNQRAFGAAASLALPQGSVGDLSGFRDVEYPVSGNRSANGEPNTAVIIPAQPGDYDGHFVIFREASLAAQSMEFLGTAVRDGVPTVSAP